MEKDPVWGVDQVASVMECTGLMPALPEDHEEDRSYAELIAIHDAKVSEVKEKD